MKFLFATVPQWYPISPYLAGALLVGQLKKAGFEAETIDFNIEFFNDILTSENVKNSLVTARAILSDGSGFVYDEKADSDINRKRKTTAEIRKNIIKEYLQNDNGNAERIAVELDEAIRKASEIIKENTNDEKTEENTSVENTSSEEEIILPPVFENNDTKTEKSYEDKEKEEKLKRYKKSQFTNQLDINIQI